MQMRNEFLLYEFIHAKTVFRQHYGGTFYYVYDAIFLTAALGCLFVQQGENAFNILKDLINRLSSINLLNLAL